MNHLRRELAPVPAAAWTEIEDEARRTLKTFLAGRRLVDVDGPEGWGRGGELTGRTEPVALRLEGVEAAKRVSRPLLELRTPFRLDLAEMDAVERGATDPDLDPVIDAARLAANAEDHLVFEGDASCGVTGIAAGSPHAPLEISTDYGQFPKLVARAVATLRTAGIDGPYAVALGPRCYTGVVESTEHGGYPVLEHLRLIAGGPVIWAQALDGSAVVSLRGGDYRLVLGQDLAIGYQDHRDATVGLYLEESLTFVNDTPEAAVALRYP